MEINIRVLSFSKVLIAKNFFLLFLIFSQQKINMYLHLIIFYIQFFALFLLYGKNYLRFLFTKKKKRKTFFFFFAIRTFENDNTHIIKFFLKFINDRLHFTLLLGI